MMQFRNKTEMEIIMNKFKHIVAQEGYRKNAYNFEKKLVEENGAELFRYNSKGNVIGLDYFNFATAAMRLLGKIYE